MCCKLIQLNSQKWEMSEFAVKKSPVQIKMWSRGNHRTACGLFLRGRMIQNYSNKVSTILFFSLFFLSYNAIRTFPGSFSWPQLGLEPLRSHSYQLQNFFLLPLLLLLLLFFLATPIIILPGLVLLQPLFSDCSEQFGYI